MPVTDVADLNPRLAELIDAALRGEEVVLARGGFPIAKLVAIEPRRPRRREPGRFEGQGVEHDPDWWKSDDELTRLFEDGGVLPGEGRR